MTGANFGEIPGARAGNAEINGIFHAEVWSTSPESRPIARLRLEYIHDNVLGASLRYDPLLGGPNSGLATRVQLQYIPDDEVWIVLYYEEIISQPDADGPDRGEFADDDTLTCLTTREFEASVGRWKVDGHLTGLRNNFWQCYSEDVGVRLEGVGATSKVC